MEKNSNKGIKTVREEIKIEPSLFSLTKKTVIVNTLYVVSDKVEFLDYEIPFEDIKNLTSDQVENILHLTRVRILCRRSYV